MYLPGVGDECPLDRGQVSQIIWKMKGLASVTHFTENLHQTSEVKAGCYSVWIPPETITTVLSPI